MKVLLTSISHDDPNQGFVSLLMALSSFRLALGMEFRPPDQVLPWQFRVFFGPMEVLIQGRYNDDTPLEDDQYLYDYRE